MDLRDRDTMALADLSPDSITIRLRLRCRLIITTMWLRVRHPCRPE